VPQTGVVLFSEEDGSAPLFEWFDAQPAKVQEKCIVRLERLREIGHELRRPEAIFCGTESMSYGSAFRESSTGCCISFFKEEQS
jgi:hypothetical protein